MNRLNAAAAVLALAVASAAWAQERWIYALPVDGSGVFAVDGAGTVVTVGLTRGGASAIYATPGGKFVFVGHAGASELSVIDAETREQHGTVNPGVVADGIVFAPTGEKAYIAAAGASRVLVYDHKRSVLTPRGAYDLGGPGAPLLLNRRGTRLYRSGDSSLGLYLETTGETIKNVKVPNGPAAWAFTPDFRQLWGVPLAGGALAVVDERNAQIARTLPGPFAASRPVFGRDGARVYLLPASRDRIAVVNTRSFKDESPLPSPARIDALVPGDGDSLWTLSGTQMRRWDLATGRVTQTVTLPRPASALTVVELRPGEGFACF
jgi:DNA-binding beta-propeller fold protein YncE